MKKYLIEFSWGFDNPVHEELEVKTDNLDWTLEQIARNRGGIEFKNIKRLDNE